jgi:MSHA pilin protein MshD
MKAPASESGFTLIESIVTIVIIAIAMTGLVAVWSNAASRSADPLWQSQTSALGKFYIQQIHRQKYSAIKDYEGGIKALSGENLAHYEGFTVKLSVTPSSIEFGLPEGYFKKISILISAPTGASQQFVTYRGRY